MKILITGATGFLGRHLKRRLESEGHLVTGLGSKEFPSLAQFKGPFEEIYHLAAWTQAGDFCLRHPGEQWIINQRIHTDLLSWWHQEQPQAKLICIGTSCSYDPDLPLVEENYLVGTPIESLLTYAMTKRMLLLGLQALHKQFGLNYLYLIPSTLYGPGYSMDRKKQLHFIFDLTRKILRGAHLGERVVLWGDGEQKRELIHVEDFIEAMLQLRGHSNCWVNIGSGEEHSIKQFAQTLCDHVGYPFSQIEFDLSKYVGARSKVLSIALLKRLYPEFKSRPLAPALAEIVAEAKQQIPC